VSRDGGTANALSLGQHPDVQELRDWLLYGPRDPEVAMLVERLALKQNMRVSDIERLIVDALNAALAGEP
jgi:hypothetical protein